MNTAIHFPIPSLNYLIWTAVPIALLFTLLRVRAAGAHWSHTVLLIAVSLEAFWAVFRTMYYYVFVMPIHSGSPYSVPLELFASGVFVHPISGMLVLIGAVGFRVPNQREGAEPRGMTVICRDRVNEGHRL